METLCVTTVLDSGLLDCPPRKVNLPCVGRETEAWLRSSPGRGRCLWVSDIRAELPPAIAAAVVIHARGRLSMKLVALRILSDPQLGLSRHPSLHTLFDHRD